MKQKVPIKNISITEWGDAHKSSGVITFTVRLPGESLDPARFLVMSAPPDLPSPSSATDPSKHHNLGDSLTVLGLAVAAITWALVPNLLARAACVFVGLGILIYLAYRSHFVRNWRPWSKHVLSLVLVAGLLTLALFQLIPEWKRTKAATQSPPTNGTSSEKEKPQQNGSSVAAVPTQQLPHLSDTEKHNSNRKSKTAHVSGNDNTIYSPAAPVPSVSGNGNTIVGPTDSRGNSVITQPGTAIGRGAKAGPNGIAIGAGAGGGESSVQDELSSLVPARYGLREVPACPPNDFIVEVSESQIVGGDFGCGVYTTQGGSSPMCVRIENHSYVSGGAGGLCLNQTKPICSPFYWVKGCPKPEGSTATQPQVDGGQIGFGTKGEPPPNPAPSVSAPNGVAIGGNNYGNPTVNNYEPPLPRLQVFPSESVKPLPERPAPRHPQVSVGVIVMDIFYEPALVADCSVPCRFVSSSFTQNGDFYLSNTDDYRPVEKKDGMGGGAVYTKTIMPGTHVDLVFESITDQPLTISNVRALHP